MLLTGNTFEEISHLLRESGGRARQRKLQVAVTLATASGERIDARLHHFARGGVGLITNTPLQPGDRFGFTVGEPAGMRFLFCEVFACRPTRRAFSVSASFLAQEVRTRFERVEVMN